jgi:hypothetical protein
MSMKKILMAAVAVSALTAGAASAATITAAKVSGVTLAPAASTPTVYTMADSVISATSANVTVKAAVETSVSATLANAPGRFEAGLAGTNYAVVYTLSGTASPTFSTALASSDITLQGLDASPTCVPGTVSIVSGGGAGQNSVTAVFNIPTSCTTSTGASQAPNGVKIAAPFKIAGAGSVTGTVALKIASTDALYDGAAVAVNLVQAVSPYSVTVANPAALPTKLAIGTTGTSPYSSLLATSDYDGIIGTVKAAAATAPTNAVGSTVYATLAADALPAITADATVSAVNGNFGVIKPSIDGTALALATPTASVGTTVATAVAGFTGTKSVTVAIGGSNTTSVAAEQTYSATITPILASATFVTAPAATTGSLETVGLQGTTFVAPWLSGSQSASNTVLRIANSSAVDTGAVTLTLTSGQKTSGTSLVAVASSTCTSSTLTKLTSIAGNGELQIDATDLTTCFGAFKRGDVTVVIQASKDNLSAKVRSGSGSTITEVSLGNLRANGLSY